MHAYMQTLSMHEQRRMLTAMSVVQVEICNLGPLPGDEVRPTGFAAPALLLDMHMPYQHGPCSYNCIYVSMYRKLW